MDSQDFEIYTHIYTHPLEVTMMQGLSLSPVLLQDAHQFGAIIQQCLFDILHLFQLDKSYSGSSGK